MNSLDAMTGRGSPRVTTCATAQTVIFRRRLSPVGSASRVTTCATAQNDNRSAL